MKRLHQGNLHPKIEVPRLTAVGGEHSRKEPLEQLFISYSETSTIQHMSAENAHNIIIIENNIYLVPCIKLYHAYL
jgi:hypothetical protein